MYISRIYNVYHNDIIIKKVRNKPICSEVGIYQALVRWAYDWNIPGIYLVYTMHIPKSFWYSSYIPRIFMEYTIWYILCIYLNIPRLYIVHAQNYALYILGIYIVYFWDMQCICIVSNVYTPPSGWCCRGGQGPIPPAPPATTSESPGRVIIFLLLEQGIDIIPGIYQVYTRYIQGIYQMPTRGQAAESDCKAGPEAIYSTTAL